MSLQLIPSRNKTLSMFPFPPAVATEKENHQEMSCATGKRRFWRLSRHVKVWPVLRVLYVSTDQPFPPMILVCAELHRQQRCLYRITGDKETAPFCLTLTDRHRLVLV